MHSFSFNLNNVIAFISLETAGNPDHALIPVKTIDEVSKIPLTTGK